MKIGVVTDTHENMPKIDQAVKICNREKVDLVIHCGDFISPITASHFKPLTARMEGVYGNNDGDKLYLQEKYQGIATLHKGRFILEEDGKRILIIHEPDCLDELIESGKFDLIFYGHTHYLDIREGKTLVVNPGETGGWITGRCTMALVDTNTMSVRIIDL